MKEKTLSEVTADNQFSLFSDDADYTKATREIYRLIEAFIGNLEALQTKYARVGAADTEAREEIALYVAQDKLRLFKLRERPDFFPSKRRQRRKA